MSTTKILVAEDDANIRQGLVDALESEGYRVVPARDGAEALRRYEEGGFDLLLLDVMMPGRSGYDVCRGIRARDARTPILLVTAKGEEIDKVVGLELGADDYITKPFGVRELLARVAAALRRSRAAAEAPAAAPEAALPDVLRFGECEVDRKKYRLARGRQAHELSARELRLVELFSRHPDEVLTRERLLNDVWGIEYLGTTRTLDQHIAQLRKKVERDAAAPRTILTVHGVGYRYRPGGAG